MENWILKTDCLSKQYKGIYANKEITIAIPKGEIVGFVGENGSGKTTFMRMICGLTFPSSGSFSLQQGCRIGAVIEQPAFYRHLSGKNNLWYQCQSLGISPDCIPEKMRMVGLNPEDRKAVRDYSLGMRQRLGIATALLGDPEFLLLDEPMNGLDPQGIVSLRKFLQTLAASHGITILISSHILGELAQLATSFLFLHKGEIVQSISSEELHRSLQTSIHLSCTPEDKELLCSALSSCVAQGYAESVNLDTFTLRNPLDYQGILRCLQGIRITDLQTQTPSLENYYFQLIGGTSK